MAGAEDIRWVRISTVALCVATAAISVAAAFVSVSISWRKSRRLASRVSELETSVAAALEKGASERRGRVRAQQALRKALAQQNCDGPKQASSSSFSYPMAPIATVQSCFSTRNGTPRQPLLVPLARACLVFDPSRVPPEALEGLADYSHCWILYVFHLNTDLDKLWNEPSRSKFKAKVRVPRLKGGKMGVLSTRSPHRPCPIGLTVAKVEALDGHAILLSGVDLVDGTPVLDIKPYLPYSDSINGATVPEWLKVENSLVVASVSFSADFSSSLSSCWIKAENQSLYASPDELQSLIKEVLSWDIRSLSQKSHPHRVFLGNASHNTLEELVDNGDGVPHDAFTEKALSSADDDVTYHLILEGFDVSYRIDDRSNIMVEKVDLAFNAGNQSRYNYLTWRDKLKQQSEGRERERERERGGEMLGSAAMEAEPPAAAAQAAARSSILDSIRGCGLAGMRIDKEELRRMILMPDYLRVAMAMAVRTKDWNAGVTSATSTANRNSGDQAMPEAPMVVFVNSRSGGRHGPALKVRLQELMSEEQVFDLSAVKPSDVVQYGLTCLEKLADLGNNCAKATRAKLRVIVAGGDGTVGWVLGALAELFVQKREPIPPTGIIPLGTGNDLSRSFDWGGSFPFAWRSAVKSTLYKAVTGPVCRLDSWHVAVVTPDGESIELPHSLRRMEKFAFGQDQDVDIDGELPEKISCFEGVYYNYFSIGMDAQVAYGFHRLRNKKPYLAQGPISNKLIYSSYSCTQGWFCTPCVNDPGLRGLKNILRLYIKKASCADWEQILVPSSVRAIVALNLPNYASGRHPWGRPEPEYLEKRGFVEAHADDGLLEIFGIKQGWHASFVMTELISAKHLAQAAAIKMEIRGGQWKQAYLQMDGEPWKQPIVKDFSTYVVIKRVPFQSLMISGK